MEFTRGRRLALELVLLGALYLIATFSDELFLVLTAFVLVVGPTASVTVAVLLVWTSRQAPEIVSLRERADDAVTLALASLGFAAAGATVFVRLLGYTVPGRPIVVLLGYGALLVLVPGLAWLGTWRRVWLPYLRRKRNREG